eukprot:gene12966-23549_t
MAESLIGVMGWHKQQAHCDDMFPNAPSHMNRMIQLIAFTIAVAGGRYAPAVVSLIRAGMLQQSTVRQDAGHTRDFVGLADAILQFDDSEKAGGGGAETGSFESTRTPLTIGNSERARFGFAEFVLTMLTVAYGVALENLVNRRASFGMSIGVGSILNIWAFRSQLLSLADVMSGSDTVDTGSFESTTYSIIVATAIAVAFGAAAKDWLNRGTSSGLSIGFGSVTTIIILEGVTSIGDGAFEGCSSATTITIPEGVTSIGSCAFKGCSSATTITIPEGVTTIGRRAFRGCSSATTIAIPEGVTTIANGAFAGCSSATTIAIPEGVTTIGRHAFRGCSGATTIAIPDGVTTIGDRAFFGCSSATTIAIPEGVTTIGDGAFVGCTSIAAITTADGAPIMIAGQWLEQDGGWSGQQRMANLLRPTFIGTYESPGPRRHRQPHGVALGASFNLDTSLAVFGQLCEGLFDPQHLTMHDANSPAYGEGVTRQWLLDIARELLTSCSSVVVQSDLELHLNDRTLAELDDVGETIVCTFGPLQLNGKVGVVVAINKSGDRWEVRFEEPRRTLMVKACNLTPVSQSPERNSKARARWSAIRALARFVFRTKQVHVEQVVSLSPLTDLETDSKARRGLRGLGRVLGATLVRSEPIGVALSAPFCKLLIGQDDLITWKDLEAVLPANKFAPLAACLEPGLSLEEQQEKFDYFVEYGLLLDVEDGDAVNFTLPSREVLKYEKENPGRAAPVALRQNSVLEDGGGAKAATAANVAEFAAAWARKELIVNTEAQLREVMQGLSDIAGAREIVARFATAGGGGWQAFQRQVRGSLDIDVAEWREATTHMLSGGGSDASTACNLFWGAVAELSAADRLKLLQFWCSRLPPAGGLRSLGPGSRLPITLIFVDDAFPRTATCFHQMSVPATTDRAKMCEFVAIAVAHSTNFGVV